jgi:hypothetical protein
MNGPITFVYRGQPPDFLRRAVTLEDLAELHRQEAPDPKVTTMPVLVTAVMPVRDMFLTLGRALSRLAPGAQSVPIDLIVVDGGSDDPCADVLSGVHTAKFVTWCESTLGLHQVTVLPPVVPITHGLKGGKMLTPADLKEQNIGSLETMLTREVKTKYTLYVDADVEIPVDCVRVMLDVMELEECGPAGAQKTAMVGVLYDWSADHVKFGCALARTEVMREISFSPETGCPCRLANDEVKRLGWKVSYLPPETVFRSGYGGIQMVGSHARFGRR